MLSREKSIKLLEEQGYGVELMKNNWLDIYDSKNLFVDRFKSQADLSRFIEENLK